jgi:putative toxin-antitoxin system antitoxin component (TIGR02293 family)
MKNFVAGKSKKMTGKHSAGGASAGRVVARKGPWKTRSFPVSSMDVHSRIDEIKKGYSIDKFEQLKEDLGVNKEMLARIASISLATMHRRKVSLRRLTSDESEKIYRLEKLYRTALDVLEDKDNVKAWLNTAQVVFEGKTPLEYADTLPGSEEVERVLRRIEHGVIL